GYPYISFLRYKRKRSLRSKAMSANGGVQAPLVALPTLRGQRRPLRPLCLPAALPDGHSLPKARQSLRSKIFLFSEIPNHPYIPPVPFRSEGRVANVTKREAECDGRGSGARRGDVDPVSPGIRRLRVQAA